MNYFLKCVELSEYIKDLESQVLLIFIAGCALGFLIGFFVFWIWLHSVWCEVKRKIDEDNNIVED